MNKEPIMTRSRPRAVGLAVASLLIPLSAVIAIAPKPALAVSLPAHVLTGYWHDFNNGSTNLKLSQVNSQYDIIAVAFATATGAPGAVTFSVDPGLASAVGGYTDAQFKADVTSLESQGKAVIISVGGQNGAISVSD